MFSERDMERGEAVEAVIGQGEASGIELRLPSLNAGRVRRVGRPMA